ncbi:chromosomal serine/threonine-protein kinase JIL-1 isoform X2 [Drosophila guanche]|uniref:non-specific serine/threonine protein kinase n=2 Tax=Drosophila guanche TaxID=7266 RepID=A0A3B0KA72_DROGU|nr:chromosomal serine/threonine-protein kinase JIL-1 isoform X2 [Drosophila guanche]SPP85010.1 blast:Chromosomal serine/threonine-protein kinase JIL-1 [Drosophila guanche]
MSSRPQKQPTEMVGNLKPSGRESRRKAAVVAAALITASEDANEEHRTNGHATNVGGKRRRASKSGKSPVLTNGDSKRPKLKQQNPESATTTRTNNKRYIACSNNNNNNNNNSKNINVTNGQQHNNNKKATNANNTPSPSPPKAVAATATAAATAKKQEDYNYRDTMSPPTPPSPPSPPINVAEVVCISDGESEENEPADYFDRDTEEEDDEEEPELVEVEEEEVVLVNDTASTPTTKLQLKNINPKNIAAAAAAAAAAAEAAAVAAAAAAAAASPNLGIPTSNSTPLDLNNEAHQKDLEAVTDLRSYVKLYSEEAVSLVDFEIIRVLGTGAYGRVFLVRKLTRHDAGQLYAMKVLNKITVVQKRKTAEHTKTERVVLEAVQRSPFLVGLHYAFQSTTKLYLVLDFAKGGELFTHLYHAEHFDEPRVRVYIAEVVLALEQLHQLGIIYRDIKLENILLDGDGHIVLSDFGLSKILSEENDHRAHSFCGTLEYMAPEIIRTGPPGHDSAVDWWSVGVLTFELLTGGSPFATSDGQSQQSEISRRIQRDQPQIPSTFSAPARDFVLKMLEKNPKLRLGKNDRDAKEIKQHPFFHGINWYDLRAKRRKAPYKPVLTSEDDVQNFSSEFTEQRPEDVECEAPPSRIRLFRGYTYVAPEHLEQMRRDSNCHIEYCNKGLLNMPSRPQDLDLGSRTAGGSYGTCYFAVDSTNDMIFMVKVVPLSKFRASEVDALTSCAMDDEGHQNIVQYLGTFRDKCDTWILTEFLVGEELSAPIKRNALNERTCRDLFRQILEAVRHIHSKKFIHGDLKPENIVFESRDDMVVKLVDFGSACYSSSFTSWQDKPRYTLDYAPPEMLKDPNMVTYTPAVDVYGLGATLYTMLVGHPPYRQDQEDKEHSPDIHHQLRRRMQTETFNHEAKLWLSASPEFRRLVEWCMQRDPANRPQLDDILASNWVQSGDLDVAIIVPPPPLPEEQEEQKVEDKEEHKEVHEKEKEVVKKDDDSLKKSTTASSGESFLIRPAASPPLSEDEDFRERIEIHSESDFLGFHENLPPLKLPSQYFGELPLPVIVEETSHAMLPPPPLDPVAVAPVALTPKTEAEELTNRRPRTRQQRQTETNVLPPVVAMNESTTDAEDSKVGLYLLMQQLPPPAEEVPLTTSTTTTSIAKRIARTLPATKSSQMGRSKPDSENLVGFSKTQASWRKSRASWRHFCLVLSNAQKILKRFKVQRQVYCLPHIKVEITDEDVVNLPQIYPRPKARKQQLRPLKVPRPPTRVQPERARALRQRYVFE